MTKNGHDMFEISSLLQKSIRRSDYANAGYAANELFGRYHDYLWKRLFTISAEDCFGIITKELVALKQADDFTNSKYKGYDKNPLFVCKAVVLLLQAQKNRDADYFACNLMNSDITAPDERLKSLLVDSTSRFNGIPNYTYDCHTRKGKMMGKTKDDMVRDEQAALNPHKEGIFDKESWDPMKEIQKRGINDDEKGFPFPSKKDLDDLNVGQSTLFE